MSGQLFYSGEEVVDRGREIGDMGMKELEQTGECVSLPVLAHSCFRNLDDG